MAKMDQTFRVLFQPSRETWELMSAVDLALPWEEYPVVSAKWLTLEEAQAYVARHSTYQDPEQFRIEMETK